MNNLIKTLNQSSVSKGERQELEVITKVGVAVYRARAVFGLDIDDTEIVFRKSEGNSITNFLTITTNLSTGIYNLRAEIELNKTLNGKIYNSLG